MPARLLIYLFVLTVFSGNAQPRDTILHTPMQDSIAAGIARMKLLQKSVDSISAREINRLADKAHESDSINMVRTMDEFMHEKREQDKRLARQVWIKGVFFAFMLLVVVTGFVRRRKQRKQGETNLPNR